MSSPAAHKPSKNPPKTPAIPQPSSSVLLISPTNQILLLHRISAASSFASAHVFPGGALSAFHDGTIPPVDSPQRHQDGPAYRMAAIRETFEECGILLATCKHTGKFFTAVSDVERDAGRKAVHDGTMRFADLLERWGAVANTDKLVPFTRWITPGNVGRRFSTQMYVYMLPLGSAASEAQVLPRPTHDGGIEHTAARFGAAWEWVGEARRNRIILFPPQFFLLWLLAPYLSPNTSSATTPSTRDLQRERDAFLSFLSAPRTYNNEPEVCFADACISPTVLGKGEYGSKKASFGGEEGVAVGVDEGVAVLALDRPGREARGRRGLREWVVTTRFRREGPRDVEVWRRGDVFGEGEGKGRGKL